MKSNYKMIVFDWDGTLMDSAPRIVSAMKRAAVDVSLDAPDDDSIRHIIGLSLDTVFDLLFPQATDAQRKQLFEAYRFQYVEGDSTPTPLFEGVEVMLENLREKDYRLAVATGKGRGGLDRVIQLTQTGQYFHDTICADEANSKPHPEMLFELMKRNQIKASEMLMIGDTSHDMKMARSALVDSIGVTFGAHEAEKLLPHNPLFLVNSIHELLGRLDK